MNIYWYAIFILLSFFLSTIALFFGDFMKKNEIRIRIDPVTILVSSFFLYSASMPVSRLMFGTIKMDADIVLLRMHFLGFLGFALGAVVCFPFTSNLLTKNNQHEQLRIRNNYQNTKFRTALYVALLVVLFVRYFWVQMEVLNFNIMNIYQPYAFEAFDANVSGYLIDVFVYFGLYSLLIFGVVWDRHIRHMSKPLKTFIYTLIAIIIGFWFFRGSRNCMTILGLPLVAVLCYNRKMNILAAVGSGLAVMILFYALASVRNIGFINATASDFTESILAIDPNNGELGTSYNVLYHAHEMMENNDLLFGRSYVLEPILNMVPRSWWPDRPDGLAIEFSKMYFNTNQLSEGLGFSPVLEAYLNFGQVGIMGVFAVIFIIVKLFQEKYAVGEIRTIMLTSFAMPFLLNWNRIDMSTSFKMFSGFILFSVLLPKIMIKPNPVRSIMLR